MENWAERRPPSFLASSLKRFILSFTCSLLSNALDCFDCRFPHVVSTILCSKCRHQSSVMLKTSMRGTPPTHTHIQKEPVLSHQSLYSKKTALEGQADLIVPLLIP